jgi:hypothetical protein
MHCKENDTHFLFRNSEAGRTNTQLGASVRKPLPKASSDNNAVILLTTRFACAANVNFWRCSRPGAINFNRRRKA